MKAVEKINPDVNYLFLDEIQQKNGWERWIRTLYDQGRFKQIFVSGSSASLLSQDIGRVLTGRHVTFAVFPARSNKIDCKTIQEYGLIGDPSLKIGGYSDRKIL